MSDTAQLVVNPVGYFSKRKVTLDFKAPPGNTRPLIKDDKPVVNFEGKPMGAPYASPIPNRDSSALYDLFTAGGVPGSYLFPSGIPFTAKIDKGKKFDTLVMEMVTTGNDTGVRFLPWSPDACTYMQLDDAAKFWLTGPLSGCNIYAAGDGVKIWIFHANSNKDAANLGRNNDIKRTVAMRVAAGFGPCTPLWGHLERGDKFYGGLGYVFGTRKGYGWANYYCDGQGHVTQLK